MLTKYSIDDKVDLTKLNEITTKIKNTKMLIYDLTFSNVKKNIVIDFSDVTPDYSTVWLTIDTTIKSGYIKYFNRYIFNKDDIKLRIPIFYPSQYQIELLFFNWNDINKILSDMQFEQKVDIYLPDDLIFYNVQNKLNYSLKLVDSLYMGNQFEVIDKPVFFVGVYDKNTNYGYIVLNDSNILTLYYKQNDDIVLFDKPLDFLNNLKQNNTIDLYNVTFTNMYSDMNLGNVFKSFFASLIQQKTTNMIFGTQNFYNQFIFKYTIDEFEETFKNFFLNDVLNYYNIVNYDGLSFDIFSLNQYDILHDITFLQISKLLHLFNDTLDSKYLLEFYKFYINNKDFINFYLLYPQFTDLFKIFDDIFTKYGFNYIQQQNVIDDLLINNESFVDIISTCISYFTNMDSLRIKLSSTDIQELTNQITLNSLIYVKTFFGENILENISPELLQLLVLFDITYFINNSILSYKTLAEMVLKNNVVSITKNPHISGSLHDNIFNKLEHPVSTCIIDMNYNSKRLTKKQSVTSIFVVTNPVSLPESLTETDLTNLDLFLPYNNLIINPDTFLKQLIVDVTPHIVRQSKNYVFVDMKYVTKESKQIYVSVYEPLLSLNQYNVSENTLQNMSILQMILDLFKQYDMLTIFKTFPEFFNNISIIVSYLNSKDNVFGNVLQLHNTKTNNDMYVHIHDDQIFVNNQPLIIYKEPDVKQTYSSIKSNSLKSVFVFNNNVVESTRVVTPINYNLISNEISIELSNVVALYNKFSNRTHYYYKSYKRNVSIITMNYRVKNNPITHPIYTYSSGVLTTHDGLNLVIDKIFEKPLNEVSLGVPSRTNELDIVKLVNTLGNILSNSILNTVITDFNQLKYKILDDFVTYKQLSDILNIFTSTQQQTLLQLVKDIIKDVISNYPPGIVINDNFVKDIVLPQIFNDQNLTNILTDNGFNVNNPDEMNTIVETILVEQKNLQDVIKQAIIFNQPIDSSLLNNEMLLNMLLNYCVGCSGNNY